MNDIMTDESQQDVAIIGVSGRFPGAADLDQFWQNLRNGVECISFFSDTELLSSGNDPSLVCRADYVKAKGIIENIEVFDAGFFGFTPREAEILDPQQRLFLECAWEALENSGYDSESFEGLIGVYAGQGASTYLDNNLLPNRDLLDTVGEFKLRIGNDKDYISTRLSYKLNLKGPSLTIQTACSTSLVAVVQACQSLLSYQCDIALAGGVSLSVPQKKGYIYQEGMITSPDGHCRAFDEKARGTVRGEGVGIVVLKRLEEALADGDHIRAVVKGSAVNNDGSMKVGFTAPSVEGQAEVIAMAQAIAGIDAETISYVEAHGTGTPIGDPIELAALTKAFRYGTEKKGFCGIGSLKTNIGHTDAAAGVAGLIKTVLALENKELPPSLHFKSPNPEIDFTDSPFYVVKATSKWDTNGRPRRAGVSSFGIGGTNAHVILEEAPATDPSSSSRPRQLLVFSAKTDSALETSRKQLAQYLKKNENLNLADVAFTLQTGRRRFSNRKILVCRDLNDAVQALDEPASQRLYSAVEDSANRPIVFMFSGQGSQYVDMALELYQLESTFREQVDLCADVVKPYLGHDIRDILYPGDHKRETAAHQLSQTAFTQPAIFVIEYALAKLLNEWGIHPSAMIGHSIGEYVAACLAGVFSLEEALSLVVERGRLIQSLPPGAMLAAALSEQEIGPFLGDELSLAAINGPKMVVISGVVDIISALENELTSKGVSCRRLHTSHAFHSQMLDPILPLFKEHFRKIGLKSPAMRFISNVTGTWITDGQATDPSYWVSHLRETVSFSRGITEILKSENAIMLEVGPGRTLTSLVYHHADEFSKPFAYSTIHHPKEQESDSAFLLKTLGRLWLAGVKIDWAGFYKIERRHRIPLPPYPFERKRHWIEPVGHRSIETSQLSGLDREEEKASEHASRVMPKREGASNNNIQEDIADIWRKLLGIDRIGVNDNYFEIGGDSLTASQLVSRMRESFKIEIPLDRFFEEPTVSALADLVVKARWQSQNQLRDPKDRLSGYEEI